MELKKFLADQPKKSNAHEAKRIGVHASTYGRWLKGGKPEFQQALLIARRYGVDTREIFKLIGREKEWTPIYEQFFGRAPSSVAGTSLQVSEEDRDDVRTLIDILHIDPGVSGMLVRNALRALHQLAKENKAADKAAKKEKRPA